MFELAHISFAHGAKTVIDDVSLRLTRGCFYGIIGPNGSGKTTLIDLLTGHLRPDSGRVLLDGRDLRDFSRKALARRIALVPQDFRINFPYSCREVVMMGRYPHIPRFTAPAAADRQMVNSVLRQASLTEFAHRPVHQLSGGERQRVVFARSLAQDTEALLLDEATANLDVHHALALLDLAAGRAAAGRLVVAVLQDINLAAMYCGRLVVMQEGRVFAHGPLDEVLTEQTLHAVFKVKARVARHAFSGARQVVFQREAVV
ncbi:MAG: ABC transporter ATP-binding protein [Desulfatitalea sp.]|nr:ABC transporter ATP-binding protein [Desulfatitalea sp.]NNJ99362.1 ABC transporter ATP-binding protein [Desulfatitalea sp.]